MMWNNTFPNFHDFYPFSFYQWPHYPPSYMLSDYFPQNIAPFSSNQGPLLTCETACRETQPNIEDKSISVPMIKRSRKYGEVRIVKRKERQDNFEKKKQKKDRNMPSNICRFFISFLYQHTSPEKILECNSNEFKADIQSCIISMKKHIKENQTYVRPCLIEYMCRDKLLEERESKICRILFQRFVKVEFRMIISMMRKLKKKQKVAYFKLANRFLRQFTSQQLYCPIFKAKTGFQ